MGKWDGKTLLAGDDVAYNDRLLLSDQSQAEGSQDRNVTRSGLSRAIPKYEITEASHGLSVGDLVTHDGSNYIEATADTEDNAQYLGLVTEVIDTDTFVFQSVGFVDGLSGLTAGQVHYLQDAGGLGTSPGTVEAPVLRATSTTAGWMLVESIGRDQMLLLDVSRDETTDLTTGTNKFSMRMPYAFELKRVKASVTENPTGANLEVDINEGGVSVLSTVLSIDDSESTSETAATPAVVSDSSLAADAVVSIDVDQIGSGQAGKGLKVYLIGRPA